MTDHNKTATKAAAKAKTSATAMMLALRAPFEESEYEWRVQSETHDGKKVQVLCYVQARAIMNRLDEVCGCCGWQVNYEAGPSGGVMCNLGIKSPDDGHWVWKSDGAENTNIEAVKGGISSALKRAGNAWGIGRLLYELDSAWVELSEQRRSHYHKTKNKENRYWDAPKLPARFVKTAPARNTPTDATLPEPASPPEAMAKAVETVRLRDIPTHTVTDDDKVCIWQAIQAYIGATDMSLGAEWLTEYGKFEMADEGVRVIAA